MEDSLIIELVKLKPNIAARGQDSPSFLIFGQILDGPLQARLALRRRQVWRALSERV